MGISLAIPFSFWCLLFLGGPPLSPCPCRSNTHSITSSNHESVCVRERWRLEHPPKETHTNKHSTSSFLIHQNTFIFLEYCWAGAGIWSPQQSLFYCVLLYVTGRALPLSKPSSLILLPLPATPTHRVYICVGKGGERGQKKQGDYLCGQSHPHPSKNNKT